MTESTTSKRTWTCIGCGKVRPVGPCPNCGRENTLKYNVDLPSMPEHAELKCGRCEHEIHAFKCAECEATTRVAKARTQFAAETGFGSFLIWLVAAVIFMVGMWVLQQLGVLE